MFASLLIANRGEIAVRIAATAHAMGVRTVAVYTRADAGAAHVAAADTAIELGTAPGAYLDADRVLAAAAKADAEAVHPGYGFLAENADFAAAVRRAGRIFVGPRPQTIRLLGDKARAKSLARKAGVPVLPDYHGATQTAARFADAAAKIGYPVIIKAVAGGGGRGMRIVRTADQMRQALDGAAREADAAFGDGRLFLEKLVANPRHLEVQVFGDGAGKVVHLGTRDCSVQRRHQKVIEEAPAPNLGPKLTAQLTKAACAIAREANYEGAGTAEFLIDRDGAYFFLEMNTRLQVEHPVTEMITGEDLVAWQLRIAAGETLPKGQAQISFAGHAFEARLCAEEAAAKFRPSAATIEYLQLPLMPPQGRTSQNGARLRIDSGYRQGDTVSPHYDSLLAKIIVAAESRKSALKALKAALVDMRVVGPATNQIFLLRIARGLGFAAGRYDTGLVARGHKRLTAPSGPPADGDLLAVAALVAQTRIVNAMPSPGLGNRRHSPWHDGGGWRLGGRAAQTIRLVHGSDEHEVELRATDEGWQGRIGGDGDPVVIETPPAGGDAMHSDVVTIAHEVTVADNTVRLAAVHLAGRIIYFGANDPVPFAVVDPLAQDRSGGGEAGPLAAPMPGRIAHVAVRAGDRVTAGARLVVVEAMKMEHEIVAPVAGRVDEVLCRRGDQVAAGAVLVRLAEP